MRIRQIQMMPVRNSLRELLGTAQSFAKSGEPVASRALLNTPNYENRSAADKPRITRHGGQATDVTNGTFELRHSVILSSPAREYFRSSALVHSSFYKQFPLPFPPQHSPSDPATAGLPDATNNHPSWMAMGMVRPRQQSNQTTRKQLQTTK